jgi:hypothetical protein
MKAREPLWTLDELSARVARALAVDYEGQASGRVRDVPDGRTIRYYTTLGLVDRPAASRGRTALYGARHLLQLVAIKRLQARNLSLAEVQARLVGLTDAALRKLAQLPADFEVDAPAGDGRAASFWKAAPAPAVVGTRSLTGVPLDDRVTLLLDATRPLSESDVTAIRAAAAPLLELLTAHRLLGPGGSPSPTKGTDHAQRTADDDRR